ncbi:hypothetical protein GGI13_003435 [Coemansia sp. RSA 455]|nr:hypothetical protein LPJ71_001971 [Coemansia sp. S17]KAJ2028534.1 hypothetical protein H4S03_007809 [Coemansia sp. S3946]KAJ2053211.1 hypothetical protein H4S04_000820 [Coemansia sp. S16]KAJ2067017.1 hypothetical protein GGI08_001584 [Coemansia sp. S2]KAJ2073111.1 hypothetical protein GGH13_002225 [Coemansia sp. S155-1]KAJ2085094.1 hypothetical protein GGI16_006874 [Coemansia sp. S142-1]KAJ2092649.1 hypothetical protein GGI09_005876 [Coemansia sp. S100]KAJ2115809.1 hypothetical protein IW
MSLIKYTFIVVSLTLAHNSVAEMTEVGYAPQTLVAAQQYMINRPTFARGDGIHGYGHDNGRAGQDASNGIDGEPESAESRDIEASSSETMDNSAAPPCGGSLVLTVLLAAGSVWAAAF